MGINPCARGLGEGASRLDGGGCVPHVGFPEVRATSWEGLVGKPWVGGDQAPGRREEKADQGLRSGSGGGGGGNPQSGSAIPGLSIQPEAPQRVRLAPTSPDASRTQGRLGTHRPWPLRCLWAGWGLLGVRAHCPVHGTGNEDGVRSPSLLPTLRPRPRGTQHSEGGWGWPGAAELCQADKGHCGSRGSRAGCGGREPHA